LGKFRGSRWLNLKKKFLSFLIFLASTTRLEVDESAVEIASEEDPTMTEKTRDQLRTFAEAHRSAFERDLKTLVEIPSISASPAHENDMRRCAEAAKAILESAGAKAEILETPGQPLVYGRFDVDPSAPTVTVYNHMDVQPANEPEWRTDPFKFVIENGCYRGRGTTDDKGPALSALYGAKAAREANTPVNIHFLWELEEEIGSPNFRAGIEKYKSKLKTNSVVVSDTIWLTRGKPSTPAGLRGLQTFSITLETAAHDLHSGLVGGAARNPLAELCTLVAEMGDGISGEVKIPGFYDDVAQLSPEEERDFLSSGFSVETFMRDHEMKSLRTKDPLDVMKRIWAKPTLEVHGLVGGYVGPGIKSAVAGRAEIKLSCRLVPNMRAEKTLESIKKFVLAHIPDAKIVAEGRLEPYKGRTTGPHADAVRDAYQFAFGSKPAFTREGGSIGAVPTMEDVLGVQVFFLGLSLPEHGYHAPNENYDWEQASGGIPMFARYFANVAKL
jgi:acetylornithine deacetylase/succinyl-diaminopimelate desuccinylase-like protein